MNKKDLKYYDYCRKCGVLMRKSALYKIAKSYPINTHSIFLSEEKICKQCISKLKGEWKYCPICGVNYFEEPIEERKK